jgi:8-oxo-dGTP pyrophosphatase MutT (NUDIX family)
MDRPSHDPTQRRPHGLGDAWVDGDRGRFWGTFGAAGLLLAHPQAGVLLQHRAVWSHHGGTWGVPGGARQHDESARSAAIREADEEAGVPPELVKVLGESVFDVGYWSYTTVLAVATELFEPFVGDAESIALRWVPIGEVARLPLHPNLAISWPELRAQLALLDPALAASD